MASKNGHLLNSRDGFASDGSGLLALFECSPFAQLAVLPDDPTFTVAAVSEAYLGAIGRQREEVVGFGWLQVFPQDVRLHSSFKGVLRSRAAESCQAARITPIPDANGGIAYLLHSLNTPPIAAAPAPPSAIDRFGSLEINFKENRSSFTPEMETIYGLEPGTLAADINAWKKFIVPEDAVRVETLIRACLRDREPERSYEYRITLPDGGERWLLGKIQVFYDGAGAPERLIGLAIDIDGHKRAEAALRQSEERLRAIFDGTYEYIGLLAPNGTLLETNRALLEFAGSERDEVVGRRFWETPWFAGAPGAQARVKTGIERAAGGEFVRFEESMQRPSGEWLTFDISFHPVRNERGEVALIVPEGREITERKLSEEQFLEQWRVFDIALSNIPDFVYTFDVKGRITYANQSLLKIWCKTLDEAMGKTFFELGHPAELAKRLHEQIDEVIKTGKPLRAETDYTSPSGHIGTYDYIFTPVLDREGKVHAVVGSTRDITERARAQEIVQEDRRRWHELLQHTPAAMAVLRGPEHIYEWVNDDYLQLVGRPASAIIGKPVLEALPEMSGQSYIDLLNQVYETGQPREGHESLFSLNRGDGVPKETYINFLYGARRSLTGQIEGVFVHTVDVTEMVMVRKQVEERERQFRTLADSIPNLAWMADASGHISWYNRRWYDFTGTSFEQIQGWQWQSVHDPQFLPEVMKQWQTALDTGEPFEMTFPLRRGDGEFRSFLTRVEPVKNEHGHVVRWFGTNTDVTAQQRIQDELRRVNRELEEFAYVSSHDLQEPLRMVNIYVQLLLRRIPAQDEQSIQYGEIIQRGVNRMETLLKDLLTFSRTVHSENRPYTTADLAAALKDALSIVQARIEETGAKIKFSPLPMVSGETSQLSHVFQNLVGNALKYAKAGIAPELNIDCQEDDGYCTVSVGDNGIGFDQGYAQQIFGLFKRLHGQEYPGTGLGLAICKRIIERYGGDMWAQSRAGEGSTFYFRLPVAKPDLHGQPTH